jgi:molybdenum cofactor cytidylyltransferase
MARHPTRNLQDERPKSKVPSPRSKDRVAAILLAAGRSRRMGAFKPLLPFGKQTVIETCVGNLQAAKISEIIVVVGNGAEDIQMQLQNSDVTFVVNPDSDSEMSASIGVGVKKLTTHAKAVVIALADHPAIPASIITQLIDKWRESKAQLIQPEFEGHGGHPVLIDLTLRTELMNLDPQRGLRSLFDAHRALVRRVAVNSPLVARDMDTWEDYLQLHWDVFGERPRES